MQTHPRLESFVSCILPASSAPPAQPAPRHPSRPRDGGSVDARAAAGRSWNPSMAVGRDQKQEVSCAGLIWWREVLCWMKAWTATVQRRSDQEGRDYQVWHHVAWPSRASVGCCWAVQGQTYNGASLYWIEGRSARGCTRLSYRVYISCARTIFQAHHAFEALTIFWSPDRVAPSHSQTMNAR